MYAYVYVSVYEYVYMSVYEYVYVYMYAYSYVNVYIPLFCTFGSVSFAWFLALSLLFCAHRIPR